MTEERAFELIVASLGNMKESKMLESNVELNTETILLGVGSPLDSIGFVTFVTDLEDRISSEANKDLYLVLNEIDEFNINVEAVLEGDYSVNVNIKFVDTSSINLSDLVIHTVLTETDIEFEQAPGSNGETKFYDVTRLMLPSKEGTLIRQLVDQGELAFTFKDALLSSWNLEHLNFVVYIQNTNTKEVFQTGSTFE